MNRAELRELADLYFARFGGRLEARVALSEARFSAMLDELLGASEARLEARLSERLEARLAARMDERITASETSLQAKLEARLDERISGVRLEIAGLRADVAVQMRDQMKWMFTGCRDRDPDCCVRHTCSRSPLTCAVISLLLPRCALRSPVLALALRP